MLKKLTIQNYALIEWLEIGFSPGLTIITGETGAGKSILAGALSLLLGERAELSVLKDGAKKCVIEATFDVAAYSIQELFKKNDLDYEKLSIIRREISAEGRSRAFVNDTPLNLNRLKEIGNRLIDIHSQYQTLTLNDKMFQLAVVDTFSDNDSLLNDYRIKFNQFKKIKNNLISLIENEKKARSDQDYYRFQYDELEASNLLADEQEKLESEAGMLNHSEEIKANLTKAVYELNEDENSLLRRLNDTKSLLLQLSTYTKGLESLHSRFQSACIEIKDVASELEIIMQATEHDPQRMEELDSRLNLIYNLQKKHNAQTINELLQIKARFLKKLEEIDCFDEEKKKSEEHINMLALELLDIAGKLSEKRKKHIHGIEKYIKSFLSQVGMPHAGFKIDLQSKRRDIKATTEQQWQHADQLLTADGTDDIGFLFKANKGNDYKALNKVASGGELSRLMLGVKSMLSKHITLPTIIFDEIDTGVSGEIADKTGNIMKEMAKKMQVLAITHLPQIASKADTHFLAYKQSDNVTTRSGLRRLSKQEQIDEIAKMLSGEKLTDAAINNAKELLKVS